ncbi:ECF RNA polymerase sigma factor SigL [Thermoflexales bacterium]|nr:ECF RNA polymerase sigma factor SigL [Thermoflexales bacterium]
MSAGDERALEALYCAHSGHIYNYALRLVNDEKDAEEITQDVFLGAWKNARRFNFRARVITWLLRIAHNQAVDRLRARRATSNIDDMAFALKDERSADEFAMVDIADQIRGALDHLSPGHRAVIELTFVHGLSCAEIAKIMDIPYGTVRSRMHYAMQHIRRLVSE